MTDQNQDDRLMAKEVNLEELMEVVTSYKCRFCDFTSTTVPDMATHLQKTHVSSNPPSKPLSSDPVVVKPGAEPEPDSAILSEPAPELPICEGDGTASATTNTAPGTFEAPTFFSNLGLASSQGTSSPRSLVSPALPDPKVLTKQMRSVAKNLPIIASSQSDLRLLTINSSTGAQSLPITSFQLTSTGLALAPTATTLETIPVPLVDNTKDLGTGPTSIAPVTKEMFMCGVCNLGFIAMDECKTHMEREHHAPVESAGVSDTIVDKYEQRISVGTQATGKRPGRKRKSEMPPPSSSPPPAKDKDWHGNDDENDEDWIPGRSFLSGARDGRQRRKIRAPKALKEDYVTEKKRKYRKRQMLMKESFRLECSYMGCPSKFRSQESLEIHHECHNKEDDAFTCPHCHQPFEFWKPLRIHLHRQHNVDCDMYRCDVCQYKTDTLHKLGVHREIHSENRPYTCDVCGKGFKQLSQMKNHQIIHVEHQRSARGTWFSNKTCEICKRTFANSKCLKKHVEAVHGQNKPFQCQYCSHTTAWKAMLILHERTHTGEKPFKCDVCHYATGDHNSLRRHKMRHTGQRQYKCQLCSYACIQSISLKAHMRNKHPNAEGVVYTCQLCKFRTINKQIYDNHMEDHRNGLIPEAKLDVVSTAETPFTVTIDNVQSGVTVVPEDNVQFQLQVKKMETGELHANKEDIDKLNSIPQLVHSGMDANQLIYSALNIGSQVEGLTYTAQLLNGVQSTVCPSLQPAKGVLSSYSITFQAPQILTTQPPSGLVVDFQSLTDAVEPIAEGTSETSEPSSQGVEQDVVLTLREVSQGTDLEPEEQILYTQVQQMIETTSKDSGESFQEQTPGFEMLQDPNRPPSHEEGGIEKETENFAPPAAVVVSQAEMDGVIHNIIVMESSQAVQGMMEGGEVVEGGQVVTRVIKGNGEIDGEQVGDEAMEESVGSQVIDGMLSENQVMKADEDVEKVLVMAADSAQKNESSSISQKVS